MTGLLPEGLRDRLPGEAEAQGARMRAMLDAVTSRGFDRVAPALVEYEESLAARLKGARTELARFVDPVTQRTLAVRSDITPQVARLAGTRLSDAPRPLRLAYAGQVLKLGHGGLDRQRETLQVGAELIGRDDVEAASEIIAVALAALRAVAAPDVTVDLTMPDLVAALGRDLPPDGLARLQALLDQKDAGTLESEGFAAWLPLLEASNEPRAMLAALRRFDRAGIAASRLDGIERIAASLAEARVTLDPSERHGFEYQSWFGFSLFVGSRAVGRGGSYVIERTDGDDEPAVGFSIYPDTLES